MDAVCICRRVLKLWAGRFLVLNLQLLGTYAVRWPQECCTCYGAGRCRLET